MNKGLITSVRPKECELIASGRQTMLVRKTRPKIQTSFKCYIYMTATKERCRLWEYITAYQNSKGEILNGSQKVIGSFVCDRIDEFDSVWSERAYACVPTDIPCTMPMSEENAIKICKEKGCMTLEDIIDYFGDEEWRAYFWHISDLKIYDKPKELEEFRKPCGLGTGCEDCGDIYFMNCKNKFTRPPKSFVYVEELENE